ncbi:MAG: NrdH-redoxin [Dehalococcoidia bacterium]|nr:NrdH-redoxin [Dehalococcoidia bacterium]
MDIKVYGTQWCPDCKRSKQITRRTPRRYEWTDISEDEAAADLVRSMNNGRRTTPTIVFQDGSWLAEPSNDDLVRKLRLP